MKFVFVLLGAVLFLVGGFCAVSTYIRSNTDPPPDRNAPKVNECIAASVAAGMDSQSLNTIRKAMLSNPNPLDQIKAREILRRNLELLPTCQPLYDTLAQPTPTPEATTPP